MIHQNKLFVNKLLRIITNNLKETYTIQQTPFRKGCH